MSLDGVLVALGEISTWPSTSVNSPVLSSSWPACELADTADTVRPRQLLVEPARPLSGVLRGGAPVKAWMVVGYTADGEAWCSACAEARYGPAHPIPERRDCD